MAKTKIMRITLVSALVAVAGCASPTSIDTRQAEPVEEPQGGTVESAGTYNGEMNWCEKTVFEDVVPGRSKSPSEKVMLSDSVARPGFTTLAVDRGADGQTDVSVDLLEGPIGGIYLERSDERLRSPSVTNCRPLGEFYRGRWGVDGDTLVWKDGVAVGFRREGSRVLGSWKEGSTPVQEVGVFILDDKKRPRAAFVFAARAEETRLPSVAALRESISFDGDAHRWVLPESNKMDVVRVFLHSYRHGCEEAVVVLRPEGTSAPAIDLALKELRVDQPHIYPGLEDGRFDVLNLDVDSGFSDAAELVLIRSFDSRGRSTSVRAYEGTRLVSARRTDYRDDANQVVKYFDERLADGVVDRATVHEFDETGRRTRSTTRVVSFDEEEPPDRIPQAFRSVNYDLSGRAHVEKYAEPSKATVRIEEVESDERGRPQTVLITEQMDVRRIHYNASVYPGFETLDGTYGSNQIRTRPPLDGRTDARVQYTYGSDDLLEVTELSADGKVLERIEYDYDDKGRLIRESVSKWARRCAGCEPTTEKLTTYRSWMHTYDAEGRHVGSRMERRGSPGESVVWEYEYSDEQFVGTKARGENVQTSRTRELSDSPGPRLRVLRHNRGVFVDVPSGEVRRDEKGRLVRVIRDKHLLDYQYRDGRLNRVTSRRMKRVEYRYECGR